MSFEKKRIERKIIEITQSVGRKLVELFKQFRHESNSKISTSERLRSQRW